jgi:hypothetical protein
LRPPQPAPGDPAALLLPSGSANERCGSRGLVAGSATKQVPALHLRHGVVTGTCPGVEQRQGGLRGVGEESIGEVAVGQRPGEPQGADHQSEDRERVCSGPIGICGVKASCDVVDDARQFVGEDLSGGGGAADESSSPQSSSSSTADGQIPGGIAIGIAGPPDPDFARRQGLRLPLRLVMALLSFNTRRAARHQDVRYSFLFMHASGAQLGEITNLIDTGALRPIIDRTYPFDQSAQALAHVEDGRSKGKVVITMP